MFGTEPVWRWTADKLFAFVYHTAFLTASSEGGARGSRVRAPDVVDPEQHLGPLSGLQRVLHRLGELGRELVLGEVDPDLVRVDELGERLEHLGHLRTTRVWENEGYGQGLSGRKS